MADSCPYPPIRRVITGHSTEGKSVFIKDEKLQAMSYPGSQDQGYGVHASVDVPTTSNDSELTTGSFDDYIATFMGVYTPNGSCFRVFELAPGSVSKYHRTTSLDYLIVAEGSVTLKLDDGKTASLKKGDVVCQRGTAHTWKNEGTEWARMYIVMLGAKPITVNGEELKEDWMIKS